MTNQKKAVSLKDIAMKAGVSTSLVSFVLNDKYKEHRVNAEVAQKVKKIAKEMNYRPNIVAKSLRSGKTRSIGVVVSDIANPFFSQIARHIEETAEKYDYMVQFASSDENANRASLIIENLLYKGVDGLILVPCIGNQKLVAELIDRGIPMVLLDRYYPELKTNYVCLNNVEASKKATEHLIEEGYSHIGMIAYDGNLRHMTDRVEGYRQAMSRAGFGKNVSVKYVSHADFDKTCEKAVSSLIATGVDAILMASNNITVRCLRYLVENNVRIPDDMGIVGFDGGDAFEFFYSPLSYVQQPLNVIAQKATEILIDQIESESGYTQSVEISGNLIVKASSLKKHRK